MPTRGQDHPSINPKGASSREIALATNEMLKGYINCVDRITVLSSQPAGVMTIPFPNCHYGSMVELFPRNLPGRELLGRSYVSDIRDGEFDLTIEHPPGADLAIMWGDVDDITLDATASLLKNYTISGDSGDMEGSIDPVGGLITIPKNGVYSIVTHVMGNQGNSVFNESAWSYLAVNAVNFPLASYDIANNKTSLRSFNATISRIFNAGDQLGLGLQATAGLGLFNTTSISFEVKQLENFDIVAEDSDLNVLVIG